MMPTQLSTPLTRDQAYALVDAIMERDDLALSATAREESEGVWIFEAICDDEPDLSVFATLAEEVLGGGVSFSAEEIDAGTDWVSRSLDGLPAVLAGGFYVHGGHIGSPAPHGSIPILIEAAQAFGTGHHETTSGCLEAINLTLKHAQPRTMLDVGTGTGVLAIALAKRTKLPVIATDIDPVATRTASENARLNGVSKDIFAVTSAGLDHPEVMHNGPYDLIVANILAGPLTKLAPAIADVAGFGATVILSGILNRQAARVVSAYAQQGIVLRRKLVRGDWTTLILERHVLQRKGTHVAAKRSPAPRQSTPLQQPS
jgi:ribosomal protein L11 methyltransferase